MFICEQKDYVVLQSVEDLAYKKDYYTAGLVDNYDELLWPCLLSEWIKTTLLENGRAE